MRKRWVYGVSAVALVLGLGACVRRWDAGPGTGGAGLDETGTGGAGAQAVRVTYQRVGSANWAARIQVQGGVDPASQAGEEARQPGGGALPWLTAPSGKAVPTLSPTR